MTVNSWGKQACAAGGKQTKQAGNLGRSTRRVRARQPNLANLANHGARAGALRDAKLKPDGLAATSPVRLSRWEVKLHHAMSDVHGRPGRWDSQKAEGRWFWGQEAGDWRHASDSCLLSAGQQVGSGDDGAAGGARQPGWPGYRWPGCLGPGPGTAGAGAGLLWRPWPAASEWPRSASLHRQRIHPTNTTRHHTSNKTRQRADACQHRRPAGHARVPGR
ncbi:hypothetical protein BDV95DRAFT_231030 [Massariosphaeria phaeospora]|uniref:Uncharacterized protein n=1 Tax=Massariosphaeria phaeospora TaxID=100035 RepID=A0A7C8ID58_9PLEO|nr:hypothetical protein BDV95DRAFT_231030 [Massariosphaeria phaeospora]